jgi:alpha-galactosidase
VVVAGVVTAVAQLTVEAPDLVRVQRGPGDPFVSPARAGVRVTAGSAPAGLGLQVDVDAAEVSRVVLRWVRPLRPGVRVLGDAWERSYGELAWCGLQPERPLPWTVLVHDPGSGTTTGLGVEVRGAAFAFWTVDEAGTTLWLDLRAGTGPVRPGGRTVTAAVVRSVAGEAAPFAVQQALYRVLCRDPRPGRPIVGGNNWYYAYGHGFDEAAVVRDARTLAELVGDHPVRPFAVVDDGWSPDGLADGRRASGGPWDAGRLPTFPDMAGLAAAIGAEGVRPGIWFRPLLSRSAPVEGLARAGEDGFVLDPTHPATRARVAEDVARLCGWGFELLKHDFSTYDLLGRWGPQMGAVPDDGRWQPHDASLTTAQALVELYRCIREAAGDTLVLGCNVVGHLAAGLVEAQRTGDDNSGLAWGRTRRMGLNSLAFRLAQHGSLFAVDADCVPCTPHTPWSLNRQFLDLVARSGTALFVSVDPSSRNDAVDEDLSAGLRLALDGGAAAGVEPLDWLHTTSPSRWRSGDVELTYDWLEPWGADPYEAWPLQDRTVGP